MPRNKKFGNAAGNTAVLDDNAEYDEETDVTDEVEDEQEDTQFEFSMEPAPEDYQPDRKTPGRQRRPSFFDDKLRDPSVFEKGWQRVPVTSDEHKAAVLRELHRAKLYLNGTGRSEGEPEIGLALDDKQDDAVYFKSRVAQKRTRKPKNPIDQDSSDEDNGDEDDFFSGEEDDDE